MTKHKAQVIIKLLPAYGSDCKISTNMMLQKLKIVALSIRNRKVQNADASCPASQEKVCAKVEDKVSLSSSSALSKKSTTKRRNPPSKLGDSFSIVRVSDASYLFLDTECMKVGDLGDDSSYSSGDSDDIFSERAFQMG